MHSKTAWIFERKNIPEVVDGCRVSEMLTRNICHAITSKSIATMHICNKQVKHYGIGMNNEMLQKVIAFDIYDIFYFLICNFFGGWHGGVGEFLC